MGLSADYGGGGGSGPNREGGKLLRERQALCAVCWDWAEFCLGERVFAFKISKILAWYPCEETTSDHYVRPDAGVADPSPGLHNLL